MDGSWLCVMVAAFAALAGLTFLALLGQIKRGWEDRLQRRWEAGQRKRVSTFARDARSTVHRDNPANAGRHHPLREVRNADLFADRQQAVANLGAFVNASAILGQSSSREIAPNASIRNRRLVRGLAFLQ